MNYAVIEFLHVYVYIYSSLLLHAIKCVSSPQCQPHPHTQIPTDLTAHHCYDGYL